MVPELLGEMANSRAKRESASWVWNALLCPKVLKIRKCSKLEGISKRHRKELTLVKLGQWEHQKRRVKVINK